jgi:hypothetical protein
LLAAFSERDRSWYKIGSGGQFLTSEFSGRNKRPRYPVGTTMKRASQGDIMPMPQLN